MNSSHIRNFSIIAHIDHGKSTLADRMLEKTQTIEDRNMKDQMLDQMDLERERGITIKMQPVRMNYEKDGQEYILNLIDTPGHIDFSYEVSRALKAVEGSILLVDATQGVQAQTLETLKMAREAGLVIIPVLSKIDADHARIDEVKLEVAALIDCDPDEILETSGKTGEGVDELLSEIVERVSSPTQKEHVSSADFSSLVFDFEYSSHRGVIVYIRVMSGEVEKGSKLMFKVAGENFSALEVGVFSPRETPKDKLVTGEIGYIVTGIKRAGVASVGDTVSHVKNTARALTGYQNPNPLVFASLYPESQDDFSLLSQALGRLKLSDSSLSYEEESSGTLGRGFRVGLLGMLHLEIVAERVRREFGVDVIVTTPTITYEVTFKDGTKKMIYSPSQFPDDYQIEEVYEPEVLLTLIAPQQYVGDLMQLLFRHEARVKDSETFGDERSRLEAYMPLRELMRGFFDEVKSVSSGFASLSYELGEMKKAEVTRLDILVAEDVVEAFSRVISIHAREEEAQKMVEKLYEILPRQMFALKIQARIGGRIIASKKVSALKKDVTAGLYGGDITRKMKLREKQKKGKKKMQQAGKVTIPQDVFLKMMRSH